MLTANGIHSNGVHGTPLYPACPSDYEERPPIDITPTAPRPAWRDQFPQFTHNLSWIDADGLSHSMTLRSDDLQGLMSDLKLLKGMIRQAKAKQNSAVPTESATHDPEVPPADVPDVMRCHIHGADMARRYSKRTNGSYFSHRMPDNSLCYGRERKA